MSGRKLRQHFGCYIAFNVILISAIFAFIVNNVTGLELYTTNAKFGFNKNIEISKINAVRNKYSLGLEDVTNRGVIELSVYILNDNVFFNDLSSEYDIDDFVSKVDLNGNISITVSTNGEINHKKAMIGLHIKLNEYIDRNIRNRLFSELIKKKNTLDEFINSKKIKIRQEHDYLKNILKTFPNASYHFKNGIVLNGKDALSFFDKVENKGLLNADDENAYKELIGLEKTISNWDVVVKSYTFEGFSHSLDFIKCILLIILAAFCSLILSGVILYCVLWVRND